MALLGEQGNYKSLEKLNLVNANKQNDKHKLGKCVHIDTKISQKCESNVSIDHEEDKNNVQGKAQATRRVRNFPPPLPSLAKSHSQFSRGMPLVTLQPFRNNGRFVLQEVKSAPPVMFHPIRRDGRFVLQLVRQDDDYYHVHEKEHKTQDTTTTPEVVKKIELGVEKDEKSKSLSAFGGTSLQCLPLKSDGLQGRPPDCAVISDDFLVGRMNSTFITTASGSCATYDVSTSEQQIKAAGGEDKRVIANAVGTTLMKPSFEGRCFPRVRGLDFQLSNLHCTSVSI